MKKIILFLLVQTFIYAGIITNVKMQGTWELKQADENYSLILFSTLTYGKYEFTKDKQVCRNNKNIRPHNPIRWDISGKTLIIKRDKPEPLTFHEQHFEIEKQLDYACYIIRTRIYDKDYRFKFCKIN